ncbi:MAG TPA: hypothetical protein VEO95_00670 [Chthoniobacteraceae bacterium]|nr:hypothetical protein [Chthoniobacteraceae bacterium]
MEASGAGLETDCPICNTTVTVPRADAAKPERHRASAPFADPTPDELREELIDASLLNGKLVSDVSKARDEIARLQQQVKELGEECEHLNASATHTQAELKTFQSERQQLKGEVASFRQRLATAEEAAAARGAELKDARTSLAAREAELNDARAKLSASVPAADLEAVEHKLAEERSRTAELDAKIAAKKKALDKANRQGDEWQAAIGEWKSKTEAAEAALTEARKLAEEREAKIKSTELALQESQESVASFELKATSLEQVLANVHAQREQLASELAKTHPEIADAHSQISELQNELHAAHSRTAEVETTLNAARENGVRLENERADLKGQLDEARAELQYMAELKAKLVQTAAELYEQGEKLRLAEDSIQTLTTRGEDSRRENDSLRRDLAESFTGREMIEVRGQVEAACAERDRNAERIASLEADLCAFGGTEAALRADLKRALQERDDAVAKADGLAGARLATDNEVLRGIVARLNAEITQRTGEIHRLKRARFGLKLAYVLFGVGFLAVLAFALKVLPHVVRF